MRILKSYGGVLLVPGLALLYAAYALWELTTGLFQQATIIYTYVIAIPMVILAVVSLAGDLKARVKAEKGEEGEAAAGVEPIPPGGLRRLALVIAASLLLVVALPYVGYHIGFFVYVAFVLWAVDMRRPWVMLTIAAAMTAVVHVAFAGLLNQDLPLGPLEGLLGG